MRCRRANPVNCAQSSVVFGQRRFNAFSLRELPQLQSTTRRTASTKSFSVLRSRGSLQPSRRSFERFGPAVSIRSDPIYSTPYQYMPTRCFNALSSRESVHVEKFGLFDTIQLQCVLIAGIRSTTVWVNKPKWTSFQCALVARIPSTLMQVHALRPAKCFKPFSSRGSSQQ